MTRILFLGDIIGETGISGVEKVMPMLRETYKPDYIFANAENSEDGFGVTTQTLKRMMAMGIDGFTTGNHAFDRDDINIFNGNLPIIRPMNWPGIVPGTDSMLLTKDGVTVLLMNALGRLFMKVPAGDVFEAIERALGEHEGCYDVSVLDIHGEATSEKRAIAEYFDGRINMMVGTHTHVQTNDARTLPKGSGFITDLGMCGPERSVIGFDIDIFTRRLRTGIPEHAQVPGGKCEIAGCIADMENGMTKMEAIRLVIE